MLCQLSQHADEINQGHSATTPWVLNNKVLVRTGVSHYLVVIGDKTGTQFRSLPLMFNTHFSKVRVLPSVKSRSTRLSIHAFGWTTCRNGWCGSDATTQPCPGAHLSMVGSAYHSKIQKLRCLLGLGHAGIRVYHKVILPCGVARMPQVPLHRLGTAPVMLRICAGVRPTASLAQAGPYSSTDAKPDRDCPCATQWHLGYLR